MPYKMATKQAFSFTWRGQGNISILKFINWLGGLDRKIFGPEDKTQPIILQFGAMKLSQEALYHMIWSLSVEKKNRKT